MSRAIEISILITALHTCFKQGMLFGRLRSAAATKLDLYFGLSTSKKIQKPLWDCMPCMASVWTVLLTFSFDVKLIFTVCGINVLIEKILGDEGIVSCGGMGKVL